MPLALKKAGEEGIIKRIGGKPEIKAHLESLGFVVGSEVAIVNEIAGNIIVSIKGSRVAVSKEMAQKIYL